jgi:Zinc carboxypeptidase
MLRFGLSLRSALSAWALVHTLAVTPTPAQPDSTNGWGYSLDSLQADLARWRQNPLMRVDSIGRSVQGRPLWRVTVGESTGAVKPRIFVHARTHPAEVQSFYVLREMLNFVAHATNDTAAALRRDFAFHFVPMYNPDGVALGRARQNANGIDIEGNWNKATLEPEVAALKTTFQNLSSGSEAGTIRVALNLHSDQVNCTRFFFYHHENGTSSAYASLQQQYITGVRGYFSEGIEPWNYVVSWTSGFAAQYPESFWWLTRGTRTLALTYEDTNCPGAGDFYRTGRALALGSADYIRANPTAVYARRPPSSSTVANGPVLQRGGPNSGPVVVERRDGRVIIRDTRGKFLRVEP